MSCATDSCRQGRDRCPTPDECCGSDLSAILTRRLTPEEMARRQQEAEYLWTRRNLEQCAASGQMDSRQLAAHFAAGELSFPIGYEAADPAHREPVRVAREPLPVTFVGREPFNWSAVTRWGAAVALCVLWTLIVIYAR